MNKGVYYRSPERLQEVSQIGKYTRTNKHRQMARSVGRLNLINYNKTKKGKTYEQMYGVKKAKELRNKRIKQAKEQKVWNRFPDTKGSNNPRWLGGADNYRGEDWKEIRIKVWQRDGFRCRKCDKANMKLNAHHIIPYRISKNNHLTNLISLCKSCHTTEENKFRRLGVTNFTKKMMIENINIMRGNMSEMNEIKFIFNKKDMPEKMRSTYNFTQQFGFIISGMADVDNGVAFINIRTIRDFNLLFYVIAEEVLHIVCKLRNNDGEENAIHKILDWVFQ